MSAKRTCYRSRKCSRENFKKKMYYYIIVVILENACFSLISSWINTGENVFRRLKLALPGCPWRHTLFSSKKQPRLRVDFVRFAVRAPAEYLTSCICVANFASVPILHGCCMLTSQNSIFSSCSLPTPTTSCPFLVRPLCLSSSITFSMKHLLHFKVSQEGFHLWVSTSVGGSLQV